MAEAITIARPYAEAVFKLARKSNSLSSWSEMLKLITAIVSEKQVKALIGNPQVPLQKLREIILGICDGKLSNEGKHLVSLLIENNRLSILPQLSDLYDQLKAQHESVLEARIISAFPLDADQLQKLISVLETKFQRKVSVNGELIGGVRIEIGDQVIDSSVYGKLEAMAAALKS
jgi:F-type H+-transporting ATPase subunit delta